MKDDIPTDRVPVVTLALIAANVLTFLLVGDATVVRHGLVPGAGGADVAYAAHVGGFASGLLAVGLRAPRVKTPEALLRRGRTAWQ